MRFLVSILLLITLSVRVLGQTEIWRSADIGTVGTAGSDSYNSGTDSFTVAGAGSGITGTADSFRYVYLSGFGNMELVAKVSSLTSGNANGRAGLMMRQSVDSNSVHATISVNPAGAVVFSSRSSSGGSTTTVSGTTDTAPVWVRLVSSGSTFKGYQSADGNTWTLVSQATISMSGTVLAGMAVSSANTASVSTAVFDSNNLMVNVPQADTALKLWLRADMDVSLVSSKVNQWNDQSGNGFHALQNTAGNRPNVTAAAVNGLPAVHFSDGNSTFLSIANNSALMPSQISILSVIRRNSGSGMGIIAEKFNNGGNAGYSFHFQDATTPRLSINSNNIGSTLTSNTFAVVEGIYNQSQNKIYVNGSASSSSYSSAISSTSNPFYLGGRGNTTNITGDIAELILFNTAVSEQVRQEVQSYFFSKYRIGTGPSSAAPTFSVGTGTYGTTQNVALSAPSGAMIFYTTNNTTPSSSSTLYTGPIAVSSSSPTVIKAIAYRIGYADSAVSSATYIIDSTTAPVIRTGLSLWLKADSLSQSNGSTVAQWDDQSGNGVIMTQGTTANKPLFQNNVINSNKPVIRFDGTNDFLQGNIPSNLRPLNHTIITVYRNAQNKAYPKIISLPYRTTGSTVPWTSWALNACGNSDSSPTSEAAVNATTQSVASSGTVVALNTPTILSATYGSAPAAASHKIFLNGVLKQTTATTGPLSYSDSAIFNVGSFGVYANGGYFNGDIAEILFYEYVLTRDEQHQVEMYLAAKYGLTLDSDADGIPDTWEELYGLDPFNAADAALNPDGDSLTNLQEYQGGKNPNDFYNGAAPVITIMSQQNQEGAPSSFAGQALLAKVTNSGGTPLNNAPVTFVVVGSTSNLAFANSGTPTLYSTVNLRTKTDNSGLAKMDGLTERDLYVKYSATPATTIQVKASIPNYPAVTATFSATAVDPDTDSDGMTNVWEIAHGFDPNNPADATGNPDGDLLTNLQEYQQGKDPHDYYNGVAPTLAFLNGDNQTGPPSSFTDALILQVFNGANPLPNAPVTFTVVGNGNNLAHLNAGAPTLFSTINLRTDGSGIAKIDSTNTDRDLYLKLASANGASVQVSVTVPGYPSTTSTFTGYTADPDLDGDYMLDNWEVSHGLDPNNGADAALDPDNDGMTNLMEYMAGTDPQDQDSDGDLMSDGWESQHGLNPLEDDALLDPDGDGDTNLHEFQVDTDPEDFNSYQPRRLSYFSFDQNNWEGERGNKLSRQLTLPSPIAGRVRQSGLPRRDNSSSINGWKPMEVRMLRPSGDLYVCGSNPTGIRLQVPAAGPGFSRWDPGRGMPVKEYGTCGSMPTVNL